MIADSNENGKNGDDESRGGGSLFSRKDNYRSDAKMVERAIRERWPVPHEIRAPLIDTMFEVAQDADNHVVARVAAARAIIAAEGQNQKDDHQREGQKVTHELGGVTEAFIAASMPVKVIESNGQNGDDE